MTNYDRGVYLERKARDVLIQNGYVVIRSAGSRGPMDLVAIGANEIILVQVKKKGSNVSSGREELESFLCPSNCKKQLWVKEPRKDWEITDIP